MGGIGIVIACFVFLVLPLAGGVVVWLCDVFPTTDLWKHPSVPRAVERDTSFESAQMPYRSAVHRGVWATRSALPPQPPSAMFALLCMLLGALAVPLLPIVVVLVCEGDIAGIAFGVPGLVIAALHARHSRDSLRSYMNTMLRGAWLWKCSAAYGVVALLYLTCGPSGAIAQQVPGFIDTLRNESLLLEPGVLIVLYLAVAYWFGVALWMRARTRELLAFAQASQAAEFHLDAKWDAQARVALPLDAELPRNIHLVADIDQRAQVASTMAPEVWRPVADSAITQPI
jgi:hypothetical protein